MKKLTITILSENGDFSDTLMEVVRWVEWDNRMWRWENDTDSYEWIITTVYDH